MRTEQLVEAYPVLYHMAEDGSWPSVSRHGLLSTAALVDLFEVEESRRDAILARRRGANVQLTHPRIGHAVVRDQLPMYEGPLAAALDDGLTPTDWYRLLNEHVFFWVRAERLHRLLGARAYRDRPHLVLEFNTSEMVQRYAEHIRLTPMNTGNTQPAAARRGLRTFLPIAEYPYDKRRRAGLDPLVELAVRGGVPDATAIVRRASRWQGAELLARIHRSTADMTA